MSHLKILGLFFFLFGCWSSHSLQAQSDSENELKYQLYRQRLLQGFVRIGPNPGESLVAGIRNYGFPGSKSIDYGDQTIYQGWYIGALATEYERLRLTDLPTVATLSELHYALMALNRLDHSAEGLLPQWEAPPATDGFLLREDVPADFVSSPSVLASAHPHYGWNAVSEVKACSRHPEGADKRRNNEMSQDQVYHLLIGLALTRRFLPDSMMTIELVDGRADRSNLRQLAADIAFRIGTHLRDNGWVIRNPTGDKVKRGPDCRPYSYALAEALEYISGKEIHNGLSRSSKVAWQSLRNVGSAAFRNKDNRHMALAVGAVGDAWRAKRDTPRNRAKAGKVLVRLSEPHDWQAFYPLLWAVLHNRELPSVGSAIEGHLNAAPKNGPYCFSREAQSGFGWACSHRYYHKQSDQQGYRSRNDYYAFSGYYSGVDYLLLFNLWWLKVKSPATINLD